MVAKQDGFTDFVFDQLRDLRGVTVRSMFGGDGLSHRGTFFGIVHKGRLYFKVTAITLDLYRDQGMKPFQPNRTQTLRTYYEVPTEVLEGPERLALWAGHAMAAATKDKDLKAAAAKKCRSRRATTPH